MAPITNPKAKVAKPWLVRSHSGVRLRLREQFYQTAVRFQAVPFCMRKSRMKKQLARYVYALAIFALAVIARVLIDFVVPDQLTFITFYSAVVLVAYYLGRGPSIL